MSYAQCVTAMTPVNESKKEDAEAFAAINKTRLMLFLFRIAIRTRLVV